MVKKVYDKIYWYCLDIVEKTNIIIDRIEKVETGVLFPDHPCYKVYYNEKHRPGEFIMWIGKKGTGIELNGTRRYMIDSIDELDINRINTYLYNRNMADIIDSL